MKSIESITFGPSRAESKESAKVESIDRVGQKLPWIDRLDRLDRFRGLDHSRRTRRFFPERWTWPSAALSGRGFYNGSWTGGVELREGIRPVRPRLRVILRESSTIKAHSTPLWAMRKVGYRSVVRKLGYESAGV